MLDKVKIIAKDKRTNLLVCNISDEQNVRHCQSYKTLLFFSGKEAK